MKSIETPIAMRTRHGLTVVLLGVVVVGAVVDFLGGNPQKEAFQLVGGMSALLMAHAFRFLPTN